MAEELDFDEYDKLFNYDAETGGLVNKVRRSSRALEGQSAISRGRSASPIVKHKGEAIEAARLAWLLSTGSDPGAGGVTCNNGDNTDLRSCNLALVDNSNDEAMKELAGKLKEGEVIPDQQARAPEIIGEVIRIRDGRYMARIASGGGIRVIGHYHSEGAANNALELVEGQR